MDAPSVSLKQALKPEWRQALRKTKRGETVMSKSECVLQKMNRIGDVVESILNVLAVISVAVVILVLGREINIPVVWLDEISTYSVVWVVFIGLALGYRNDMFPRVDIICHLIPQKWNQYLGIFWDVVALVFLCLIMVSGKDYIVRTFQSGTTSAQLNMPLYIVYLGPIIGYLCTTYFTICNIFAQILKTKHGKELEHT